MDRKMSLDIAMSKWANNKVTVVLGAQWGDEGKGKVVDMLAGTMDLVCRCQGGNNAGHTVVVKETEYDFHLLPSGIVHQNCKNIIGNGVVVHLPGLFEEIEKNEKKGLKGWENRLLISNRAHLVFDFYQQVDGLMESEKGSASLGTTKKGIGPAYAHKCNRVGLRFGDLIGDFDAFSEKFRSLVKTELRQYPTLKVDVEEELKRYSRYRNLVTPLVIDTVSFLHKELRMGQKILVEGANAAMLDIDFGTYPFVTSSNCSIGGVLTGLGIPPPAIGDIIGVVKAYQTRVGDGPFPTEQKNDIGTFLQTRGAEIGVTTKRKRRCGWLDIPALKYSALINGYTKVCLTKLDILDELDEIKLAVSYKIDNHVLDCFPSTIAQLAKVEAEYETFPGWESSIENVRDYNKLPENARRYVEAIEQLAQVHIKWIGVGKGRDCIIEKTRTLIG